MGLELGWFGFFQRRRPTAYERTISRFQGFKTSRFHSRLQDLKKSWKYCISLDSSKPKIPEVHSVGFKLLIAWKFQILIMSELEQNTSNVEFLWILLLIAWVSNSIWNERYLNNFYGKLICTINRYQPLKLSKWSYHGVKNTGIDFYCHVKIFRQTKLWKGSSNFCAQCWKVP